MPMRRFALAALLLAAASPAAAQELLAARVNGTGITVEQMEGAFEELLKERKTHLLQVRDPARMKRMKREALDRLIDQELLWQEAKKKKMAATEKEVDAAFEQFMKGFKSEERARLRLEQAGHTEASYREQIRKKLSGDKYADSIAAKAAKTVADKEIKQFYKDNPDKFHRPEMARARHILILVRPDATPEQRDAARTKIEAILAEARAGKSFDELARLHSEDATKQWGGELDPFPRGKFTQEFDAAVWALKPGEISGVVATAHGFHIIKLEERIPGATVTEKQARDQIKAHLAAQKGKAAVDKEIEWLRASGSVEYLMPL